MKLTGRQISELRALERKPGLWSRVDPRQCDADLALYLDRGLVRHIGPGAGYAITDAGRAALEDRE